MVSQLNRGTQAREAGYEFVQYIAGRLTLSGADTNVKIGTIPAGAIITGISSRVATAVTGGTPVLGLGTTSSLVGGTGDIQATMAEAAGSEVVFPAASFVMPTTAPVDVYAGTSGGATAGDVYVMVQFVKPLA